MFKTMPHSRENSAVENFTEYMHHDFHFCESCKVINTENRSREDIMHRQYIPGCGYQDRRDYRAAMEKWLATIDADLFVTLSFAQDSRLGNSRQLLRQWFARIDNHYLGRGWARRSSDDRTFAIMIPENIGTNLHYHCLMRPPNWGGNKSVEDCGRTLEQLWHRVVPGGTCDVELIYDLPGAARYVAKQLVRPSYLDHYLLASEFHSGRSKHLPGGPHNTQGPTLARSVKSPIVFEV